MAKKTRTKKESMFYTRAKCASCAATRECAWLPSKGWTCRTCAGVGEDAGTLTPKARPMKKKVAPKKRTRSGRT